MNVAKLVVFGGGGDTVYVAGWVAHGARLGHYRNNVIEWAA